MGAPRFQGGGDDWWMRHRGGHWHHGGNGWISPAIGFRAGSALGSALAYPYYDGPAYTYDYGPAYAYNSADAWCAARFRSYNPVTHTYTGYDGFQHPCPSPRRQSAAIRARPRFFRTASEQHEEPASLEGQSRR